MANLQRFSFKAHQNAFVRFKAIYFDLQSDLMDAYAYFDTAHSSVSCFVLTSGVEVDDFVTEIFITNINFS